MDEILSMISRFERDFKSFSFRVALALSDPLTRQLQCLSRQKSSRINLPLHLQYILNYEYDFLHFHVVIFHLSSQTFMSLLKRELLRTCVFNSRSNCYEFSLQMTVILITYPITLTIFRFARLLFEESIIFNQVAGCQILMVEEE